MQVHIKSHFILNGVCVRFRGWVDLERLDGIGRLEYDERRGAHEDAILKEQLERYSQRLKDFEDTKRGVYPRGEDVKRDGQAQQMNGWRR